MFSLLVTLLCIFLCQHRADPAELAEHFKGLRVIHHPHDAPANAQLQLRARDLLVTCEPADARPRRPWRGRRSGGRRAAPLSLCPWQRPAPGSAAPGAMGVDPHISLSPTRSPGGGRGAPHRGAPAPAPRLHSPVESSRRRPSPFCPPSSPSAGGGSPKVVLKTQRLGEKRETCNRPGAWERRVGRGEGRAEYRSFVFSPGRDMINRFLLI